MSAAAPVVEVRGLPKRYGHLTAVDRIHMTVRRGEIYGFLSWNGAGKTTALRMLLGLIAPTAGEVSVLGHGPGTPESLGRVGSLVEAPAFYPYLSGRNNLRVVARYAGVPPARIDAQVEAVSETVDLAGRADDKFTTYSLGMKQRLGVAAALLKDPDLVFVRAAPSDIARRRLESMPEVEAGVAVTELRRGERQLEDVFLEITDESLPGPTAHEPTPERSHV